MNQLKKIYCISAIKINIAIEFFRIIVYEMIFLPINLFLSYGFKKIIQLREKGKKKQKRSVLLKIKALFKYFHLKKYFLFCAEKKR